MPLRGTLLCHLTVHERRHAWHASSPAAISLAAWLVPWVTASRTSMCSKQAAQISSIALCSSLMCWAGTMRPPRAHDRMHRCGDCGGVPQAGSLGATSLRLKLPPWLLLGDDGQPITSADAAPSDLAAAAFGLAVASADLASGHKIYGLNNMIACLIATDILQASAGGAVSFRGS